LGAVIWGPCGERGVKEGLSKIFNGEDVKGKRAGELIHTV